jgi:quercetin dioxygenase-like cupin family protein
MSGSSLPGTLTLIRAGSAIVRAPEAISSAPFWVEHLLSGSRDGEPTAMRATFDPGVRTHWHSHPRGQLLLALGGMGLAQRRGGDVIEIRAGDAVWFAPDEAHWHGAASQSVFSYVSVQSMQDGAAVHWLEPA